MWKVALGIYNLPFMAMNVSGRNNFFRTFPNILDQIEMSNVTNTFSLSRLSTVMKNLCRKAKNYLNFFHVPNLNFWHFCSFHRAASVGNLNFLIFWSVLSKFETISEYANVKLTFVSFDICKHFWLSFWDKKGLISLTRNTVCHCVLLRKYRYYNFDFSLGQSQCKCPHKKL